MQARLSRLHSVFEKIILFTALVGAASTASGTEVSLLRRPDKSYEISGSFTVDASTPLIWGVLTDYEHIPSFVSSMRSSRVRETRGDGSLLVEQKAVGDMFFLSRTVRVLLETRRSPDALQFTDVGLKDFSVYDGDWETQRTSEGVRVSYRLLARPRFFAPSFLMAGAMKRGARSLLEQVRAEIVRRELSK